MGWPDLGISLPKLPSVSDVARTISDTVDSAQRGVRDLSGAAVARASELGRAGADLAQRGVEAARNFDVREAASTVRREIGEATEAGRQHISNGVAWTSGRIGEAADVARSHVQGDGLLASTARGAITVAENSTRFSVGVVGGVSREVVGLAGTAGQLGTTLTEMQLSQEARVEYGAAVAGAVADGGRAVGGYVSSVADDPSRLGRDVGAVADATGSFVSSQLDRYGQAIAEGRGAETIGMDVGTVAANIAPIGGGPVRGAVTSAVRAGVREGAEAVVREGVEATVRNGGEALVREGGETAMRQAPEAAARVTAETSLRATAETRGADLLARAQANGGAIPLQQGAGRVADIAAAARQSGSEIAVYRDLGSGERMLRVGDQASVTVPGNSRIIAHTQPGTGAAALAPSAADRAGLAQLGQRSSFIIDESGAMGRFQVDDAIRASEARAGVADGVRFEAPPRAEGPNLSGPGPGAASLDAATAQLRQTTRSELDALRAAGMSNKAIGPAISTAMDMRTGAVSRTAINSRIGEVPADLHPTLAARLDAARELPYDRTHGAGSHAEVYAANELLQQGSRLEDLVIYTEQVGTQRAGTVKPPCPHCDTILDGARYAQ